MEKSKLISDEIIERVHRDNCFDFLRYLFAFSLILVHFCTLTETEQFWVISGQTRVKAFFTITGFLVVYSFIRRGNIKVYIRKRINRIIPAYMVVVLVCFIAGIILTKISPTQFLCNSQSYHYLLANLSFLNFLEPSLPGLFTDNPDIAVNGSLWSMKYEVLFYILVPFIIWLMRRKGKTTIMIVIFAFHIVYHGLFDYLEDHYTNPLFSAVNHASFNTIIYFFSGMAILLYFDYFCHYIKYIFPICVLLTIILNLADISILNYIEPLIFSSLIIGTAYYLKPLNFLQRYDNISYGLYLYHFPVTQIIIQYKIDQYNIFLAFIIMLIATTILATISWRLIEKPILKR